jgi:uncharacterized protein (DUF488 family)
MNTSYFAKYKGDNGVSIAIRSPVWFKGESYPSLFPKWSFLSEYFENKQKDPIAAEIAYTRAYCEQVLSKLDPNQIYNELCNKVLLCYEGKDKFCHRRIVADWIYNNLGFKVAEL